MYAASLLISSRFCATNIETKRKELALRKVGGFIVSTLNFGSSGPCLGLGRTEGGGWC